MKPGMKKRIALWGTAIAVAVTAAAIPFNASAESATDPDEYVQEVVDLTNQVRAEHDCPALAVDVHLSTAANDHSRDMADNDFMDHIGSDGRGPGERVADTDYPGRWGAENVAAGYRTPQAVLDGWMNSDGHRRNILNCSLTDIGVGYAENSGSRYRVYWTQKFGVN